MYNASVRDFVNITDVKNCLDVGSFIHMCKRLNNSKREYLFVNSLLGKHIPVSPTSALALFSEMYDEIYDKLKNKKKILVVSFAETATAIGEFVMLESICSKNAKYLNCVHYLQTTRENLPETLKLIDFSEEHSHAVNQSVYSSTHLTSYDYDTVLFVEDEITTGNTILNFIKEFNKINPFAEYFVASFLNWQNSADMAKFKENNVKSIYLVKGEMKLEVPTLKLETTPAKDIRVNSAVWADGKKDFIQVDGEKTNYRLGMERMDFMWDFRTNLLNVTKEVLQHIEPDDVVDIIGTEEFMFLPLMCARVIENVLGSARVTYHATTRSPISIGRELGYVITNGITLNSAYESERQTYLYNISRSTTNKVICIVEKGMTLEFYTGMKNYITSLGKEILFVSV